LDARGVYEVSPKNEKSPPKGAWLWSRDLYMYLVPHDISGMAKPKTSIFYPGLPVGTLVLGLQMSLQGHSHYM